jgi:hypothetical protein
MLCYLEIKVRAERFGSDFVQGFSQLRNGGKDKAGVHESDRDSAYAHLGWP